MYWGGVIQVSRMGQRKLRARCRQLLRDLDVRPPFDVESLCDAYGRLRGRRIQLVSQPIALPGPFGFWAAGRHVDYVVYQSETTKAHQDHIIVHELGHMMAGHTPDMPFDAPDEPDVDYADIFPDLDPDVVRRVLRRTVYDDQKEHEAEIAATTVLDWASAANRLAARPSGATDTDRIQTSLADRLGWL